MKRANTLTALLAELAGFALLAGRVLAQQPTNSHQQPKGQFRIEAVFQAPGEILTKGVNTTPTGKLKLKSYRLERVKLDESVAVADGTTYEYAFRFVITGERFPLTGTYLVWADDRPFRAVPSQDGTEIIAVFLSGLNAFDDGATLSVSEGGNPCYFKEDTESVLPEKLEVPLEMRAAPRTGSAILLRTVPHDREYLGKPSVGIAVTLKHRVRVGDYTPAIQVGKQSFDAGGINYEVGAQIPYDVFSRIPDNSQIFVKWGPCALGGEFVGRLNKSTLDH